MHSRSQKLLMYSLKFAASTFASLMKNHVDGNTGTVSTVTMIMSCGKLSEKSKSPPYSSLLKKKLVSSSPKITIAVPTA
jgi:hypothetical protein